MVLEKVAPSLTGWSGRAVLGSRRSDNRALIRREPKHVTDFPLTSQLSVQVG